MKIGKYEASEPLNNNAEQEHYNNGRSFFAQEGASDKNIEKAKHVFSDFEGLVEKALQGLKKMGMPEERIDRMLEKIKKDKMLTNERAVYLVELAAKDHKNQNDEPTKSDNWRRA